jgi:PAS domain S-box-containing protein
MKQAQRALIHRADRARANNMWSTSLSSSGFMPHGHCYLWTPSLVWLHVVSDALIFLAYVTIPATLVYFVRRRSDVPFDWMFMCFGVFIVSCGLTHLMEVWTVWHPSYWIAGAIKAVTAAASVCTSVLLVQLVPKALKVPSPEAMRRMSSALEASEARFRAAVEGSRDAFYIVEANRDAAGTIHDFTFSYANPQARARLALPPAQAMIGKRMSEFVAPADMPALLTHFGKVMEHGTAVEDELPLTLPGQIERWLELQLVPLGGGVAATSRDITQRKRDERALKLAEERFRALLETAPDAIVIVNEAGEIVYVNAQTSNVFQYAPGELIGRPIETLMQLAIGAKHIERRQAYFRDASVRAMGVGLELNGRRKDGSEFPVEVTLSPLQTETGLLVSSAIRDVSARKWIENALKLSNQELEAFSYSVAHDLRAPLRGMSGFAQILIDEHAAALDADARDCLQEIQTNAQRMGQLIDALLSLSRVSRSELHVEPVDLTAVARSVADELARTDPERAVAVEVQADLRAAMDPPLARTLLTNLIGNAWKFTSRTGQARIEVGAANDNGLHTFYVRDNGAGFDTSYGAKLFTPFQRLHNAQEYPGTGIGLATVQRIVHRHGGRVWAEGRVGQGAAFYFRIPVSSPGARA